MNPAQTLKRHLKDNAFPMLNRADSRIKQRYKELRTEANAVEVIRLRKEKFAASDDDFNSPDDLGLREKHRIFETVPEAEMLESSMKVEHVAGHRRIPLKCIMNQLANNQ